MRFGSISVFCLLTLALFVPAERAAAEPTPDQIAAIKANCRSDFMSKCWGVPRGGAEAMQCLKKNMASVSPGCQQALKAIAAAPPKAPAPAPAIAKPEPAPAPQPAPETTAKPAAACRACDSAEPTRDGSHAAARLGVNAFSAAQGGSDAGYAQTRCRDAGRGESERAGHG